jgi:probable F420-dependent oxidoreductase
MKFGLMFANTGPFGFPDSLARLAQAAEECGIESMWTVEHVVIPVGYKSPYPYSPSGKIPGVESVPIPDPLLPLAFAAAVTKRIRLATGILILPQRHPAYVAKEVATLDVLSKGRVILGIGSGWLAEEFEVVGVPFRERGARTDEAIRALRSLWKPAPEAFAGTFYRWPAVESNPKPVQKPGVPIVIGGHSEAAARRAARHGDGFFPARGDRETLGRLFSVLREECAKVGRDPREIEITSGTGAKADLDVVKRFQDLGVQRFMVSPAGSNEDSIRKGLDDFADHVITTLGA